MPLQRYAFVLMRICCIMAHPRALSTDAFYEKDAREKKTFDSVFRVKLASTKRGRLYTPSLSAGGARSRKKEEGKKRREKERRRGKRRKRKRRKRLDRARAQGRGKGEAEWRAIY